MQPTENIEINSEITRTPMLLTDGQRDTWATLNNEILVCKANLYDATETLKRADATRAAYLRGLILERGLPGSWSVSPDGTTLTPR